MRHAKKIKMLKQLLLLFILFMSTNLCNGQSLFFDNLNKSVWKSDENLNSRTIAQAKTINLAKLTKPADSLTINRTIWYFNDSLIVTFYNSDLKKESVIGTYSYKQNKNKGLLVINSGNNQEFTFGVGIISTGAFATLTRKRE